MDEQEPASNSGILTAAALAIAALMILLDETNPFTSIFSLDMLPTVLRKRIESFAEGVIVTAVIIKKRPDGKFWEFSDKEYQAIMQNKFLDFFGLRDDMKEKNDE